MRESVLRSLAEKAATDPEFLGSARRDLAGTLDRYGFELTAEEMGAVEDLQRRTTIVGDRALAALLAAGLAKRSGASSARPAAPARPGLPRPARPGGPTRAPRQSPKDPPGGP